MPRDLFLFCLKEPGYPRPRFDNRTTGPVLGGHLIKLANGLKVAEAEVKFEWSCSDI
jgi:hypothetical protein